MVSTKVVVINHYHGRDNKEAVVRLFIEWSCAPWDRQSERSQ